MKHWLWITAAITFSAISAQSGLAQETITLIAPNIMRAPLDQLIPGFEAKTGHKVKATLGAEEGTKQQVIRGEAFDVPLVEAPYSEIIASGNVVASSETAVANVSVGVAVRKGAPKADISTPDAVKRMFLAAKSISFPDPADAAASGMSVMETLKKLGIAEQLQTKIKLSRGGARAMAQVANGEVEIGCTFLPGITDPGVDIVGTMPRQISPPTVIVGFVSTHASDPAAAKELLTYLTSPEAAAIFRAQKMQPGR
jgi:molybdate transport system substrate-binding protein